jgi:hypothetical protein
MVAQTDEPIRLTEGQTEMLTRALAEAARQAATPKLSETEIIKKSAPTPVRPAVKPPNKITII